MSKETEAADVTRQIEEVTTAVDRIITDNMPGRDRTRTAVEIKGKLGRADNALKAWEDTYDEHHPGRDQLTAAVNRLLEEVFDMTDSYRYTPPEEPRSFRIIDNKTGREIGTIEATESEIRSLFDR